MTSNWQRYIALVPRTDTSPTNKAVTNTLKTWQLTSEKMKPQSPLLVTCITTHDMRITNKPRSLRRTWMPGLDDWSLVFVSNITGHVFFCVCLVLSLSRYMLPINECVQLIMEPPELKACSEIIHAAVHTLQRCRKTLKFFFFVVVISSISIHNSHV